MKKSKKIAALLQSCVLLIAVSPNVFAAEEAVTSGTLNDGAQTWEYADGELRFSGIGDLAINDIDPSLPFHGNELLPWYSYANEIETIVFSDGITGAGFFHALKGDVYPNLKEVYFGESFGAVCTCGCCSFAVLLELSGTNGSIQYYAPQYSASEYYMRYYGYENHLTYTGVAEDPYIKLSAECSTNSHYECDEENRTLSFYGSAVQASTTEAMRLIGRYDKVYIDREITFLEGHGYDLFQGGFLSNASVPMLYCYPEFGDLDWLQKTLGAELKVVNLENGDVDKNGTVELFDVTQMLQQYASEAAGVEFNPSGVYNEYNADVDRDDQVSLQDASFTLTYYAQAAAGLNPDWGDILYQ